MGFAKDFLWGAATASYQIEGAACEDGRGPSIWDTFSHSPGRVKNGHTGDAACDHYHRFKEDVMLMKEIGLNAYRFSVSWSRVLPAGVGAVNEKGLDFYDRLVDELLAAGIQPCATLYHWDLPQALYDRGGWKNPDMQMWFADYAERMGRCLGDRVPCWMTFNEILCFLCVGHVEGRHAPGEQVGPATALRMLKNIQLSHGRAVQALRRVLPAGAQIGLAHVGGYAGPASNTPEDVEAARRRMFDEIVPHNNYATGSNALQLDPIYLGRPAAWAQSYYGDDHPDYSDDDLRLISQPLDFLGLNFYSGETVSAGDNGRTVRHPEKAVGRTAFGWPVTPDAFYWGVRFMHERYGKPILITENGMSCNDWVGLDGCVHDGARIDFLHRYLLALRRAADEGIPLLGYMQWSLMDNFEWAEGYSQRFGLIHIDYETQKRTLKDSARWYRDLIAAHGGNL